MVSVEEGKPENLEKNPRSKEKTNNKLSPRDGECGNRTRAIEGEGERISTAPPVLNTLFTPVFTSSYQTLP